MKYRVNVLFEKDEHGYFAYCPQLKGCHSQGETFEEASENIREAVELYLETMTVEEIRKTCLPWTVRERAKANQVGERSRHSGPSGEGLWKFSIQTEE